MYTGDLGDGEQKDEQPGRQMTLAEAHAAKVRRGVAIAREEERERLKEIPFDPRKEVSADAKYLIQHLWILFVAVPLGLFILWAVLNAVTGGIH